MKKRLSYFISFVVAFLLTVLLLPQFSKAQTYTGFAMGSVLTHTYWRRGSAEKTADAVASAIEFLEDVFAGGLFAEGNVYIRAAKEIYEASDGAFNPYLGALVRLWNINNEPYLPKQEEIEEALSKTEWDFGAIGKGAACDTALLFFGARYPKAAVINLGGNILTYGRKPWGQPFKIALRDPLGGPNDTVGVFTLRGTNFISTSGSYEKYFEQDGVRYHHIFDPETGYPACRDPGLVSVTVITREGELAGAKGDAISTACFVLGYEASLDLLETYDCDALFFYESGEVRPVGGVMEYYEAR